jgi:hypothetical protein
MLIAIASCATTEKVSKRFSGAFVSYTVNATKPETGTLAVTMTLNDVQLGDEAFFCIPAWAPGAINSLSMASLSKKFIPSLKTAIRFPTYK